MESDRNSSEGEEAPDQTNPRTEAASQSTEITPPSTVLLETASPVDPDATEVVSSAAVAATAVAASPAAAPTELTLKTGDLLRDRFEVDRILGEGGMGKVFLAKDRQAESSNPWVALKLLNGSFSEHPMAFAALRREAMQSRQLNHPNIVNVYDFDRTSDHVYMVMEFMRGDPLDEFVKEHPNGNSLKDIWYIIEGSGRGLAYVHQRNIIHADFKPSNVFLTEDGEVKVLDLGIARTLDENKSDSMTTRFDPEALGALTPQYASCEMFDGLTPIAPDDLYALGCVAYELLTGKHPYNYKTAVQARAEKLEVKRPPGLKNRQWKALKTSLALVRSERQENVTDFLDAMAPESQKSKSWPWIITAVAGVAAAIGIFVVNMTPSEAEQIQAILEQNPAQPSRLASSEKVAMWLEQGDFFLSSGSKAMDKARYDLASAQLAESPNSALQSYRLALTRTDENEPRLRAAQGMLQIATVFSLAATQLQENATTGDVDQTTASDTVPKLVCDGLQAARTPNLIELYSSIKTTEPNLIRDTQACRGLSISGA